MIHILRDLQQAKNVEHYMQMVIKRNSVMDTNWKVQFPSTICNVSSHFESQLFAIEHHIIQCPVLLAFSLFSNLGLNKKRQSIVIRRKDFSECFSNWNGCRDTCEMFKGEYFRVPLLQSCIYRH